MLSFLAMMAMPLFYAPDGGNGDSGGAAPAAGEKPPETPPAPETPEADAAKPPAPETPAEDTAARAENKKLKAQLDKFEKERLAREEADLSELEKAQKQADRYKSEVEVAKKEATDMRVGVALSNAAHELGLKNPVQTLRMVDRSLVTLGEDGEVVGAKEAVEALKESVPFAFSEAPDAAPGSTSSADSGTSKRSDRASASGQPETDRDRGRQAAKRLKEKRENVRL